MADDEFVKAYSTGGIEAVNGLVRKTFGEGPPAVRAVERMEDSGDWRVLWHYFGGQPSHGSIVEYLGNG